MQQTGCLKKRRRRNLSKVTGLGLTPYDQATDTYRGLDIYTSRSLVDLKNSRSSVLEGGNGTLSRHRVTRDPIFTLPVVHVHDNFNPNHISSEDNVDVELGYEPRNGQTANTLINATPKSKEAQDQPYLLDGTVMSRIRQLLLLGQFSGAFPWFWNKKKYQIDRWSPTLEKIWLGIWTFVTFQTLFLTAYQFHSLYYRIKMETKTYRQVFMASMSCHWYLCAVFFNINMYLYKDQIRKYMNALLALNRDLCEKFLVHIDGYKGGGRIFMNLSIPSNCSQVFASVALFCVMPYQPWYLYSRIYKPENPWWWLIPGALQEFVVVGQVITSAMLFGWIVVAHCNSVNFWLKEIHNNNESEYTIPEIRSARSAIEIYRSLQILCTCFNECMAPLAIPLVKLHISTGLIPCGYVLIRSMNHLFVEEFPGILSYPIGVVDCVTTSFVLLSMSAEMFDLGCSFLDSWSLTKQKDFRRIVMSMPLTNFLDGDIENELWKGWEFVRACHSRRFAFHLLPFNHANRPFFPRLGYATDRFPVEPDYVGQANVAYSDSKVYLT